MTDDSKPEPIALYAAVTRFAWMRAEAAGQAESGGSTSYTARDVIELLDFADAQAARIAELEAERARWTTFEVRDPGAFIVAD